MAKKHGEREVRGMERKHVKEKERKRNLIDGVGRRRNMEEEEM